MKFNALMIIEAAGLSLFWVVLFTGGFQAFDTIMFFEPVFTVVLIAFTLITGFLCGAIYERYYQEQISAKKQAKPVSAGEGK